MWSVNNGDGGDGLQVNNGDHGDGLQVNNGDHGDELQVNNGDHGDGLQSNRGDPNVKCWQWWRWSEVLTMVTVEWSVNNGDGGVKC